MKHYNITVKGRVQGVFYRKSTQNTATRLGLSGFVKNLPDGNVYIEAEGDQVALDQLLEWCKNGPRMAHVSSAKYTIEPLKYFSGFEIH